jgi:hypothetical protein
MPEIDLQPHEYRRPGKLRNLSVRLVVGWSIVGLLPLIWIYFNRVAAGPDALFWGTLVFGGIEGAMIMQLSLRRSLD